MKKIPSFHQLNEHVSLFLTVIQLSIIFFVLIPPINAGTKLIPISEPNDWTGIIDALSKAKMTGQSIWISLLPPSKTSPICKTCNYSEPYRLDFISWAREIANLSLRYSSLTGYTIEDLQENLNLGYIRQTYLDSMEAESKSINPKLQFITTLPNIYYVGKNATGNGSGLSWTNKQIYTSFDWTQLVGGDTVYFDGGTDSLTYGKVALTSLTPTSQVVITNGKDVGHNGKVIMAQTGVPATPKASLSLSACQNIKITGLTFKTAISDAYSGETIIYFHSGGSHNTIDNCNIISNGNGVPVYLDSETQDTITYNDIEVLSNNLTYGQDGIDVNTGGGGHTITGNTVVCRGVNVTPHIDCIQWGNGEGGTNNYQTVIANNYLFLDAPTNGGNAVNVIYLESVKSNRFLIFNNLLVTNSIPGISALTATSYDTSYNLSVRGYNNTIVNRGINGCGAYFRSVDTLIFKNNIIVNDSAYVSSIVLYTAGGLSQIKYKAIDYNQYYMAGRSMRIDTSSGGTATWAQWRALGYDVHGDTGMVNFSNRWGTTITDYKLVTGSKGIDGGIDLSAYFTTDILGTARPRGAGWDRGAVTSK